MTPLVEKAEEYAEPLAEDLHRVVRRAFMAGALAALTTKAPRETLLSECVQFGRAVGSDRGRPEAAGRVSGRQGVIAGFSWRRWPSRRCARRHRRLTPEAPRSRLSHPGDGKRREGSRRHEPRPDSPSCAG